MKSVHRLAIVQLAIIPAVTAFQPLPRYQENSLLPPLRNEKSNSNEDGSSAPASIAEPKQLGGLPISIEPSTNTAPVNSSTPLISISAQRSDVPPLFSDESGTTSQLFAPSTSPSPSAIGGISNLGLGVEKKRRNNIIIAVASFSLAVLNYLYHFTHPLSSLQILSDLQTQSPPLTVIGRNQKPTVVDFWAPWCENCKFFAPTLSQIHSEYGNRVNFILVNADNPASWNIIEEFGVDAIPHMAFIDDKGSVETALVGVVSGKAIRTDLDGLVRGEGVSVKGFDAFDGRDRVVKFEEVKK